MKRNRLDAKERKAATNAIHPLTTSYHNGVPFGETIETLKGLGLIVLQEDNTPWSGFVCGREGRAALGLAFDGTEDESGRYEPMNNALVFTWCKLDSGRYEFVAYIS